MIKLPCNLDWRHLALTAFAALLLNYVIKDTFCTPKKRSEDAIQKGDAKDTLDLFLFHSNGTTVSVSPFSTKLAMFCRLAGIPHNSHKVDMSKGPPKGKVPYITHGSNTVGDSQLIARYLENTYNIPALAAGVVKVFGCDKAFVPFSALSDRDQAMSDMIRLLCEGELYWALISVRWLGYTGIGKSESLWEKTKSFFDIPAFVSWAIIPMIRKKTYKDAWAQGLSRHSPNDQLYFAKRDIKALSTILGKNPFFLGSFPSECDCAAFGTLEGLIDDSKWPNDLTTYINKEHPNLVEYVHRIRSTVFFDVKSDTLLVPGHK